MATEVGRHTVLEQEGAEFVHQLRGGAMLSNGPYCMNKHKRKGGEV